MTIQQLPFPHQKEAIKNLNKQFKQNNNKALVVLPSGSGKTHTIAFHVAKLKPKSFLYVVHRDVILTQTVEIFKKICKLKDSQVGIINSDSKDYDKPFLFATVQTLFREKNLDKLVPYVEYMVVDEFHHAAADSYVKIIKFFKPKYFVGLTATPFRLDEKDLLEFVDNNIATEVDLFEGIDRKILVPFHYIGLYDDIDYSKIKYSGYSYNITDLDRKLIIHKRDEAVIKEYQEKIAPQNRLTIGFCNSVNHVNRIVSKFRSLGIKAVGITYKEKHEQVESVLEAFRKGYYQVLFTRDILNEGVDFPECSAVMFLRPTISKTIFLQQLGRGLRKHPGKEDVLVLDFIGNYIRAFEKKKWFLQAATHEYTGKYIKPVYEYNHPKPIVEFDSRVVQMMEIQKHGFRTWEPASKEKIYQDYMNCCEKEGKILNTEGYRKSQYAKYSINTLLNYFDTFMNFVKECNITYERKHLCPPLFHYCNDRKKLIDNFLKVKKKFNKEGLKNRKDPISNNPTNDYINDPKNSRYGTQSYERVWGYYGNFLIEMGHVKDGVFKINNSRDIEYRNNEVKKAVEKLQEKLGRKHFSKTEWRKEYGALGRFIIDHGGFGSFKRKYNIPDKFEGKCMICGNKFNSRYTTTVVCSVKCANTKWYIENTGKQRIEERKDKLKTIQKCINCGKKYYPWKQHDRIRYSKYCSRQCMSDFGYKKRVGRKEQQ